jgi:hypothetical protein
MKKPNGVERLKKLIDQNVTGDLSSTCFPAAAQAISNNHEISPEVFYNYFEALWDQFVEGPNPKRTRETIRDVLETVGGSSYKGLSIKRAKNVSECKRILDNAKIGGRRVIIYVSRSSTVGLRPVSGGWRMVGLRTPVPSDQVLTSSKVFEYLYVPTTNGDKRRFAGKLPCNIITLNPEKK